LKLFKIRNFDIFARKNRPDRKTSLISLVEPVDTLLFYLLTFEIRSLLDPLFAPQRFYGFLPVQSRTVEIDDRLFFRKGAPCQAPQPIFYNIFCDSTLDPPKLRFTVCKNFFSPKFAPQQIWINMSWNRLPIRPWTMAECQP